MQQNGGFLKKKLKFCSKIWWFSAWKNDIFHSIIKLEGHCIEKQIYNKLRKDSSRSDDLLSSYSCSEFEKCSFEKWSIRVPCCSLKRTVQPSECQIKGSKVIDNYNNSALLFTIVWINTEKVKFLQRYIIFWNLSGLPRLQMSSSCSLLAESLHFRSYSERKSLRN